MSLVYVVLGVLAVVVLFWAIYAITRRRGQGGSPFSSGRVQSSPRGSEDRPAPPKAADVSPQRTMMMEMPGAAGDAAVHSGTVAMQWYGVLNCISGPLEGEKFLIEDAGFYVGRDPVLSKVVIDDSRISKRHVRIQPRDGKVVVTDQDSTNGTYLNAIGTPRITEIVLKRGDILILADNVASFKYQI